MIRALILGSMLFLAACDPKVPASNPPTPAPQIQIAPMVPAAPAPEVEVPLAETVLPQIVAPKVTVEPISAQSLNAMPLAEPEVAPVVIETPAPPPPPKVEPEPQPVNTGMANPATVFSIEQGGRAVFLDQTGYCQLPDGSTVEEWEYFRAKN